MIIQTHINSSFTRIFGIPAKLAFNPKIAKKIFRQIIL